MEAARWILRLLFGITAVALLGALLFAVRAWTLEHRGERATGTVIGLEKHVWYSKDAPLVEYAPRVRFQTITGQHVEFASPTGNNPPEWRVGDRIPVLYVPAHPQQAEVQNFWQLWERALVWGTAGFVFLLTTLLLQAIFRSAGQEETPG